MAECGGSRRGYHRRPDVHREHVSAAVLQGCPDGSIGTCSVIVGRGGARGIPRRRGEYDYKGTSGGLGDERVGTGRGVVGGPEKNGGNRRNRHRGICEGHYDDEAVGTCASDCHRSGLRSRRTDYLFLAGGAEAGVGLSGEIRIAGADGVGVVDIITGDYQ